MVWLKTILKSTYKIKVPKRKRRPWALTKATFKTNMPVLWSKPLPCKGRGKGTFNSAHLPIFHSSLSTRIWEYDLSINVQQNTCRLLSCTKWEGSPRRQKQGLHRPITSHLHCLLTLLQTFRQFSLILEHIPNSGSHDPVPSFWKTLCMVLYFPFLKLCSYIISSVKIQLYYFHLLTGE